jgi:hypothetical protein
MIMRSPAHQLEPQPHPQPQPQSQTNINRNRNVCQPQLQPQQATRRTEKRWQQVATIALAGSRDTTS